MSGLIYGVLVRKEEFFSEESVGKRCGCGRERPRDAGPYCSHCGQTYSAQKAYGNTALGLRFQERFKVKATSWTDGYGSGSSVLCGTGWFHQRLSRYGNIVDYALVGRPVPLYVDSLPPGLSDSVEYFEPDAFRRDVCCDPEDPNYYDPEGDPVDDSMARFLKETRDELEKLGLLEGRKLRVYLW